MQNFSDGKIPVKDNKTSSLVDLAKQQLEDIYNDNQELETIVFWLLEHFTAVNRQQYSLNPHVLVNQSSLIHFSNAVDRLKLGIPVQYVIGQVDFYQLKIQVQPAVLIPRPETEELVDIIVKENKGRSKLRILDIGTGSGCIALSLAKHFTDSMVTAIDISSEALIIAKENAVLNEIKNVDFWEMDILLDSRFMPNDFDIIVSNPPYIRISERNSMSKNVVEFEPSIALFVPNENPLEFYERIESISRTYLKPRGLIYLEINELLGSETLEVYNNNLFSQAYLINDMFGKNRFIKAMKL